MAKSKQQLKVDAKKVRTAVSDLELRQALQNVLNGIVDALVVSSAGLNGGPTGGSGGGTSGGGSVSNVDFSKITNLPTTLAGYGITDAAPSSHVGDSSHISGAERDKWNGVYDDLHAIIDTPDADNVINKWAEVVAFLAGISETSELADLLSKKLDVATWERVLQTLATKEYVDTLIALLDNKYISKINDDTAAGLISFLKGIKLGNYIAGLTGSGAYIDKDGKAEMQSLVLRESLTVPELRFNRASLVIGTDIQSCCGGVIKSTIIALDEDNNELPIGECELELGDDEMFGAVEVGDLCWGYFHDIEHPENNATEDSDDRLGNITYKGFATCYFKVTKILNANHTAFEYELKEGTTVRPYKGMTFGGRGNSALDRYGKPLHPERQGFTIKTPNYEATYQLVSSWDWSNQAMHIVEVRGCLDGFEELGGVQSWGQSPYYGTIGTNYYLRGNLHQVENDKRFIYITQSSYGLLTSGASEIINVTIRDNWYQDRTSEFEIKINGRPYREGFVVNYDDFDTEVEDFIITANDGRFFLESKFSEKKLLIDHHLEVYKFSAKPEGELEGELLFDDNSSVAFDDEIVIGQIIAGTDVKARRYTGTSYTTLGYLYCQIDEGEEFPYVDDDVIYILDSYNKIKFTWYKDEDKTTIIQSKELPIVRDGKQGAKGATIRIREFDDVAVGSWMCAESVDESLNDNLVYLDVVVKDDNYYRCVNTHQFAEGESVNDLQHWAASSKIDFLATDILISDKIATKILQAVNARIVNLILNNARAVDAEGNETVTIDGSTGLLKALSGEIGNFVIKDGSLYNDIANGYAGINIENQSGTWFFRLNSQGNLLRMRADGSTALRIESYSNGTALELLGNTGSKALDARGSISSVLRGNETFEVGYSHGDGISSRLNVSSEGVKVVGLCMNTRTISNVTSAAINATDDMVLIENSSAKVTLSLPDTAPEGKVIYIKGRYNQENTVSSSSANILDSDGYGASPKTTLVIYDDSFMFVKVNSLWVAYKCN